MVVFDYFLKCVFHYVGCVWNGEKRCVEQADERRVFFLMVFP